MVLHSCFYQSPERRNRWFLGTASPGSHALGLERQPKAARTEVDPKVFQKSIQSLPNVDPTVVTILMFETSLLSLLQVLRLFLFNS